MHSLRYRIIDCNCVFTKTVNNQTNADARLQSFVNAAMRNTLANASFPEIHSPPTVFS